MQSTELRSLAQPAAITSREQIREEATINQLLGPELASITTDMSIHQPDANDAMPSQVPEAHHPQRRHQADDFFVDPSRRTTTRTLPGDAIISFASDSTSSLDNFHESPEDVPERVSEPVRSYRKWRPRIFRGWWRQPEPDDMTETLSRRLENVPNGYPRLAAFLDSNESYMLFRRFGNFQTRLLLEKQYRLHQMERELDELDWDDFDEHPELLCTAEWDSHQSRDSVKRRWILAEAEKCFREYSELMMAAQQLRSFELPKERDYRKVRRFLHNTKPLFDSDMDCIRSKGDLIALRPPKEPDWLEQRIGEVLALVTHARSDIVITNLATAIVAFLTAVLLVLPVLICYILVINIGGSKGYAGCIGVLFLFTLIFSCAMAFYSKAKRHEVLAATAAYCAVIVVFLGNVAQK